MVYLEKLVMRGFKSYGKKRVEVNFSDSFTTVVGPNGSGKSNIGDAIQFVLGNLSSKSMRASVLQDLIFMGGKDEDPSDEAVVKIHFNNENDGLPVDDDEVIVSRKIKSDNRSIYRINGDRTSRKNILDTLMSAGISPQGHNIILQGDVTEIIKMSPLERRNIIEEVSGIEEYEDKKEEAEKELKKSEENLDKIEFRVSEVEKQVERLEEERNDALRYKHLKDKLKEKEKSLVAGKIDKLKNEIKESEKNLEEFKDEINKKQEEIDEIKSHIKNNENKIEEIDDKIENNEIIDIERKIEREKGKIEGKKRSIDQINERIERLGSEIDDKESKINNLHEKEQKKLEKVQKLKNSKQELDETINSKKEKYEELLGSLEDIDENIVELREELENIEDRLNEDREKFYDLKDKLRNKESELKENQNSLKELRDKEIPLKSKKKDLKKEKEELKELEEKISELRTEYYDMGDKESRKREEIKDIKSELDEKKEKLSEHRRQNSYKRPVREILNIKEDIKGIHGTIGDLIEIKDQDYKTAIETAIGSRLDNIVVEHFDAAKKCINYLKSNKLGRASFIPLDKIKPRPVNNYKDEGVIDLAINLIEFNSKFNKALKYVLGSTLVVEDLNTAKKIENKRMVTLEGELIEKSGKMVGGSKKKRKKSITNVSNLENEIQNLEKKRKKLEEQINQLEDSKIDLRERIAENKANKKNKKQKIENLEKEIEDLSNQKEKREMIIKNLKSTKNELESEIENIKEQFQEKKSSVNELNKKKKELKQRINESESKEIDQEVRKLEEEINDLKDKKMNIESDLNKNESKVEMYQENIKETKNEVNKLKEKIKKLKQDRKSKKEELDRLEQNLTQIKDKKKKINKKVNKLKSNKKDLKNEIEQLNNKKEKLENKKSKLKDKLKSEDIDKARKREKIVDLKEEHNIDGAEKPDDLQKLKTKIKNMKKEINELQPVNMKSIDEYEQVEERYIELKNKKEKLLEEKKSIEEFIKNMEQKKENVFLNAYNTISDNFSIIFKDLSNGGEAHMSINEEDPLDSDSGLEIEASPAGKEIKRIEAMSGGEKALTALAFLFAIQKYEPAPFYLLDEIDAHLDDKNVERVAEMIANSNESQYIVITLRDAMMAKANKIIGVTMENGISRTLGLDMEEASEIIES